MTTAIDNLPGIEASGSSRTGPNWDHVPFDVGCARCGADLRGLTEPVCPSCRLQFDWSDAVPIEELTCGRCGYHLYGLRETRCPECAEPFTWQEALAAHYRRKKPLFEYRWRRQPVRSFVRSWRLAMYPSRLWRTIDIHDPPQLKPLLFSAAVAVAALFLLAPALSGLEQWATLRSMYWRSGPVTHADLPMYVQAGLSDRAAYRFPAYIMTWSIVSLGALLLLRQSMRRRRVRTIHVVRVWVYAALFLLPLAPLFRYVGAYAEVFIRFRARQMWFPDVVEPYAVVPLLLAAVWFVRQGYRHYLKMPHGLGIAVASQIIALLAVPVAFDGIPRLLGFK